MKDIIKQDFQDELQNADNTNKIKRKKFFSSPKNIFKFVSVATVVLIALGTVSIISAYAIAERTAVGKETAVNSAYAAAGIPSEKIDSVKTKFKFDKGKFVYDVEFHSEGKEYEYKIHSKDGSVIEFEHPDSKPLPESSISIDEAKKIAVEHSGFSIDEVTFTKANLYKNKDSYEYIIEFSASSKEYEYNISAFDGSIKNTKNKPFPEKNDKPIHEKLLTVEEAKEIVLSHAGIDKSEKVYFTKAKHDKEKGRFYYEIKFIYENNEYEYEINAKNGEITEHSFHKIKSDEIDFEKRPKQ
ncbi:MAG: PepSY domain-containing protein [Clostridia bacterium]|nr:PepSY domain-containing protein [Clostridia bacterium]